MGLCRSVGANRCRLEEIYCGIRASLDFNHQRRSTTELDVIKLIRTCRPKIKMRHCRCQPHRDTRDRTEVDYSRCSRLLRRSPVRGWEIFRFSLHGYGSLSYSSRGSATELQARWNTTYKMSFFLAPMRVLCWNMAGNPSGRFGC